MLHKGQVQRNGTTPPIEKRKDLQGLFLLLHWIEFTYAFPSSSQGFGTFDKKLPHWLARKREAATADRLGVGRQERAGDSELSDTVAERYRLNRGVIELGQNHQLKADVKRSFIMSIKPVFLLPSPTIKLHSGLLSYRVLELYWISMALVNRYHRSLRPPCIHLAKNSPVLQHLLTTRGFDNRISPYSFILTMREIAPSVDKGVHLAKHYEGLAGTREEDEVKISFDLQCLQKEGGCRIIRQRPLRALLALVLLVKPTSSFDVGLLARTIRGFSEEIQTPSKNGAATLGILSLPAAPKLLLKTKGNLEGREPSQKRSSFIVLVTHSLVIVSREKEWTKQQIHFLS
ncbi:hypothetical protein Tco_1439817 [Tanacetum coccineum]